MPEGSFESSAGARPKPEAPRSWRLAALIVLLGGLAVGAGAAGGGGAGWLVLASLGIVVTGLVPVLIGSRQPPVPTVDLPAQATENLPMVTVVIAARDEAAVLPRLIEDLGAQDHRAEDGQPRFEIILIDDRSTDGSSRVVRTAAARAGLAAVVRVVRREGPDLKDGKGAALASTSPDQYRGEVIVVLDADAHIEAQFLRRIATYSARGVGALTARRRMLRAGASQLAGAQADEQSQDGEMQRGRWASGGCSEFRGNGTVIARELLAAVGGWPADALTEDLDLSTRLAAMTGVTVVWALDLEVWEEPVETWSDLWRQRVRWSEGAIRRLLEHGPSLMRSTCLPLRARLDFAVYGAQLVAPSLIIGAVVGAAVTGAAGVAVAMVGMYLVAGGVLAFDALRWEYTASGPLPVGLRTVRSARAALFGAFWLVAVPAALWRLAMRRGQVRYDKMTHVGRDAAADAEWTNSSAVTRGSGEP